MGDRDRGERGGRDRGSDVHRERGGDRDRGSRDSGRGGSRYTYQARSREAGESRATQGANDFDKIMKPHIKMWTPKKGANRVRILPPTWPEPKHYGYDIFVHYGVGPDRQAYLDLNKMMGEPDPITEEMQELKRSGDATEEEIKQMDSRKRVVVYIIDREDEAEGVQALAMSWTVDKDIAILSTDKQSGEVLNIDDPEHGYDIEFNRDGEGLKTKYAGIAIARRSTRLGKDEWLDFAIDNPIPDQLQFYTYDEIAKVFGGGGTHRETSREERGSGRDRTGSDRSRGEGEDRSRGRDDDSRERGRGGDDDRGSSRSGRDRSPPPELTWDQIHGMTSEELDALCASDDRLQDIEPDKAETDNELADWICEDLKIVKEEPRRERARAQAPPADTDDRLARMRASRERR